MVLEFAGDTPASTGGLAFPKFVRSINLPSSVLSCGMCCSEFFNATRSRAFPEACESRPAARSMSRIDFSAWRNDPSKSDSRSKSAMTCCRQFSSFKSRKGCKIQLRNFRPPIGVTVRSSTANKLVSRAPRDSTRSRFVCVAASSMT